MTDAQIAEARALLRSPQWRCGTPEQAARDFALAALSALESERQLRRLEFWPGEDPKGVET